MKTKADTRKKSSCGETTVYVAGMAVRCRCRRGKIVDTFLEGFDCPHHDGEQS